MREADRSSVHPVALAQVVVGGAGVFTLFAVSYFAVWLSRNVALGARYVTPNDGATLQVAVFEPGGFDLLPTFSVMVQVPRHHFVADWRREDAYAAKSLPIGSGRTIPEPFIVALMTYLAAPGRGHNVLEIGTGAGYQTAVLSEMVEHVYTIEPVEALAQKAAATLGDLGYGNVTVRVGEPSEGWPEFAPFDSIVVKGPVDAVPQPLIDQLALGGKLVGPVGSPEGPQVLQVLEKLPDGSVVVRSVLEVHFPPLTGDD